MTKKKHVINYLIVVGLAISTTFYFTDNDGVNEGPIKQKDGSKEVKSKKKSLTVNGKRYDGPEKYAYFQSAIRAGQEDLEASAAYPQYRAGQIKDELVKSKQAAFRVRARSSGNLQTGATPTFKERGPANVPGRTRSVLVDPDDPSQKTWFSAGVSGGIWKTTNAGESWFEIAPDLENLAIVTLAMSPANSNVIYAGTGEGFIYNGTFLLNGNGIYKSTDKGDTWTLLASTDSNPEFTNVSRIIVDPEDENTVLVGTGGRKAIGGGAESVGGIFRSTDGGLSWTQPFDAENPVQQIIAAPSDFDIQYLSVANGDGIYRSDDGGLTWSERSTGISLDRRIELGISYSDPDKIYASSYSNLSGAGSDLYMSADGGVEWTLVDVTFNDEGVGFLGSQGWYDNTVLVHPFDDDRVYFGGIGVFAAALDGGVRTEDVLTFDGAEINGIINFIFLGGSVPFLAGPEANNIEVEVRFGASRSQKAHRFLVPEGQGAGVPDQDYAYQDYVDVPFEVWDVTNDRQLMASFRDQQRNGTFELINSNTGGDPINHSREYIFIHNVDYDADAPDASIATAGGNVYREMYFFWPVLEEGATWSPGTLPDVKFGVVLSTTTVLNATTYVVADVYGAFNGLNRYVHPDQHYMLPIITDEEEEEFQVILCNDGGLYLTVADTFPGIEQGDWIAPGSGFNTTQFYGADKVVGREQYFGGTQDNGTWLSRATGSAGDTSSYTFRLGGDGFEVVNHYTDPLKMIGGSQFNGFTGTDDGWQSRYNARTGLSGNGPFVSRLSNAYQDPDVLFTVESNGVYKSENFGRNWRQIPITENWGFWSGIDVEVSKANPRFVWAGGRMSSDGAIFVSTDWGESFTATTPFADLGLSTGIYSHPTEDSTAFVVFSVANSPKILKTEDLGASWVDISGFSQESAATGFPDVAVFAVQVMPYDDDVIWAGTEIGLFETTDGGDTWAMITDFPAVTIWDFKIKDGQVIIATHGRGIWTADVPELEDFVIPSVTLPPSINFATSPITKQSIEVSCFLKSRYDSTIIYLNGEQNGLLPANNEIGDQTIELTVGSAGIYEVSLVAYKDGVAYPGSGVMVEVQEIIEPVRFYINSFDGEAEDTDFVLQNFTIDTAGGDGFSRALNTLHPYPNSQDFYAQLTIPIEVSQNFPTIKFDEIVQVEEGEPGSEFGDGDFWDYVIVEGSTNGVQWEPLLDGYDARDSELWDGGSNTAADSLYVTREIDLSSTFEPGEVIYVRFRMFSDAAATAWGWAIDNLEIQFEESLNVVESVLEQLDVYPVPADDYLNVDFKTAGAFGQTVELLSLDGQVKRSFELKALQNRVEVSGLSPGVYLMRLKDNKMRLKDNNKLRRILIQ